jgi:hypothetical protein
MAFAFVMGVACASQPARPSENATVLSSDLARLDADIQKAIVLDDTPTLEKVLAPDFLFTHGWVAGGQETRAQLLERSRDRKGFYFSRAVSEQVVELHGNIGLVLGRLDVRRRPIARNSETEPQCYALAYIHVYEKRGSEWLFLSHRTAEMVEPRRSCP